MVDVLQFLVLFALATMIFLVGLRITRAAMMTALEPVLRLWYGPNHQATAPQRRRVDVRA